ncbi:hypothetical protein CBR_g30136 [Chara braunii]|uniref:Myb/SANT-like DNA-binding domain-containing protein n=1 Tax=Chara braunii TaxID=69332 RepID=A0A388LC36_CHABU|nr:hypothetical protein CBR_g30136 [Chara braunii]|eukprot:GBG79870.1 hypothetical protein CBR_g30136 [Chara braunii]
MASMQARAELGAVQGGRGPATEVLRRWYKPSLYTNLESWETPLPPSNEEAKTEELATLPLGSGSTQMLSQMMRARGSASNEGGEFTSLLRTPAQPDLRDEPACRAPVRPGPTVENITRGVSNMRAHNDGGDDDAGGSDDPDKGFRGDGEAGDDNDDIHIRPLGKRTGRGKGLSRGAVRGRSVGRGGRGGWKWDDIAKQMANAGRPKDADDCMKKWDNLFQNYKKIQRFQNACGEADSFRLSKEERKEHNFKFRMDKVLYNKIHGGVQRNHTIFPPNVANTSSPDGVQLPRQGAAGGKSVSSEAGGDGCPEERYSARDFENNAGSGVGGGVGGHGVPALLCVPSPHSVLTPDVIDLSGKLQNLHCGSGISGLCFGTGRPC